VTAILGPVLGWLTTMLLEVFGALNLPDIMSRIAVTAIRFLMLAAKCAAIGFVYRSLFDEPWRKAGMHAWAVIVMLDAFSSGPMGLGYMLASLWFYADAAVSGAAVFAGAWHAHEQRHNQHVLGVRNGLLSVLRID